MDGPADERAHPTGRASGLIRAGSHQTGHTHGRQRLHRHLPLRFADSIGATSASGGSNMRSRSQAILQLLLLLGLAAPATAAARTISWSGYRWDVRPTGVGSPG